jgi:hypothetical protein
MNNNNKPSKAQRRAQSARDRQAKNRDLQRGGKRQQGGGRQVKQQGAVNQLSAAPLAFGRTRVNEPRALQGMGANGSRTVKFSEYVQDVVANAAGTFGSTSPSFPVQVGISALFAWLAEQAINYQEYRFRKLAFRFESDQTANIAGKVMFAFSPDAADPVPLNKQEMLEYGVKGKSNLWKEFVMPVPVTEALGAWRYVRSGTLAANLDIKTYDLGILFVALSGTAADTNAGELYVDYEVELREPVVQSKPAALARSLTLTSAGGVSENAIFGTAVASVGGLDVSTTTTTNVMTFKRVGIYLMDMDFVGTGLFTAFTPTFVAGGASTITLLNTSGISNAAANAGTRAIVQMLVTINARGDTIQVDPTTQATTITASITRIAVYNPTA